MLNILQAVFAVGTGAQMCEPFVVVMGILSDAGIVGLPAIDELSEDLREYLFERFGHELGGTGIAHTVIGMARASQTPVSPSRVAGWMVWMAMSAAVRSVYSAFGEFKLEQECVHDSKAQHDDDGNAIPVGDERVYEAEDAEVA